MTWMLLVIGVGLVGVSARLATRALVFPRLRLKTHLREIGDYGFTTDYRAPADLALGERVRRGMRSTARRLGRWMIAKLPSLTPLSTGELNAAGYYDADPELVHGYRAFAALGLPLFWALLFGVAGSFSVLPVLVIVLALLAGWVGPSAYVRRRGATRLEDVDRRLPELIDLLIATIEAGLGFTAALALVGERFQGALGEELRLTMRQQSLGMSIGRALEEMVGRCDTPSIRAFVRTATRGEALGVSIGPVLRELSIDQRRRRRMAMREKMQKAPVKLIFPMMFLIMPALMIVLFYPLAYSLKHSGVF